MSRVNLSVLAEGGKVDFADPVLQSPTVDSNYGVYASMLSNLSCITLEQQDIKDSSDVELSSLVETIQGIRSAWGSLLADHNEDNQVRCTSCRLAEMWLCDWL